MPIPVPIPGGPLAVNSSQNTLVEAFVAKMTQLMAFGTSGLTVSGQPAAAATTIPDGNNPTVLIPLLLADAKTQSFYRQMGFAILQAMLPSTAASQVNGSSSGPTTASGSFSVLTDMTTTLTTGGGSLAVIFSGSFDVHDGDSLEFAIFLDGGQVSGTLRSLAQTGTGGSIGGAGGATQALLTSVSAGSHTIDVRWRAVGGTARAVGTDRNLVTFERY